MHPIWSYFHQSDHSLLVPKYIIWCFNEKVTSNAFLRYNLHPTTIDLWTQISFLSLPDGTLRQYYKWFQVKILYQFISYSKQKIIYCAQHILLDQRQTIQFEIEWIILLPKIGKIHFTIQLLLWMCQDFKTNNESFCDINNQFYYN